MMLVQSIPFWVMLTMTFINLKIKKRFFCISTLSLSYLTLAMFGSIFLVLRPRTGWPYVRLDAMLFLTVCFILFALPALFFKDGKISVSNFVDLPDKIVQNISRVLIFITVPASVISAIISIPDMITFFQMGGRREAFRNQLIDYGGGFSSLPQLLLQLGLSFGIITVFWLIYCLVFNKQDKWSNILLSIGSLATCIASLRRVARGELFLLALFATICIILFFQFISEQNKHKLKKYAVVAVLIFAVPFMAISIGRFKKDICYSFYSYFTTGPYSFSADYAARVEGNTKPLNGYLTIGWHLFLLDKAMGSNYYKQAKTYDRNYHYSGNKKQASSPEIDLIYRRISGSYSAEFPTLAGILLKDYHISLVIIFSVFFSIFYCMIFSLAKKPSVAQSLCASVYFYILSISVMLYPFMTKRKSFHLALIWTFIILLSFLQAKYYRDAEAPTKD